MEINKVSIKDLQKINEIQKKYFYGFNYYKYETLINMSKNKNVLFLKAIENNIIKGYIIAYILIDHIDIYQIATDLFFQKQGIASKLLKQLNKYKLPILIEVNEHNTKAINFYESHGFKIVKIIKKYYECSDGYLYRKD